MAVQAIAADESVHEFPDGTDQGVIDRAMREYAQGKGATEGFPQPPAKPDASVPLSREPAMEHIGGAVAEAFRGPYGPSEAFMKPFVGGMMEPINRAVVGGGLQIADALSRPFQAVIRGGAAAGSEVARAFGSTESNARSLERDLNVLGDVGLIETAAAPAIPKVRAATDAAGGAKALAQSATRAIQESRATQPVSDFLAWMWDVNKTSPEKLQDIEAVMSEGGRVPIEQWAPTSTFLGRLTEIARGWGYDPVKEAATPFYERKAGEIARDAGLPEVEGGLTSATAAVPTAEAGAKAVAKATEIIDGATDALDQKVQAFRQSQVGPATREAREVARTRSTDMNTLVQASEDARAQARQAIDQGFADIDKTLDQTLSGHEIQSGELMRQSEGKLRDLRGQVGRYFRKQYDAADEAAAGHAPNATELVPWAQELLDGLLPPVRAQYPREIELLTKLAEKEEAAPRASGLVDETGRPIPSSAAPAAAPEITFGQLHELRNWVRHAINWEDLAAGPKQGVLKLFENKINEVLHDSEAAPALKDAARMLDATDKEYGQVIPRFKDSVVRQIVKSGAAAAPENAAKLASMIITEGNTERISMLRDMLGPEIWSKVKAADLKSIVAHSLDETGKFDASQFARKIMERDNLNMLSPVYGSEANSLITQAKRVQQYFGKFDINVLPGDTVTTLLQRADNAIQRAESLAEFDPLKQLSDFTKKVDEQAAEMRKAGKADIARNPLSDLLDLPAEAAAKKVLGDRDLFRAAAQQFGVDSQEFNLLRQTWVRQFLQRSIDDVRGMAEEFAKQPEDIQRLLFPGVTRDQMVRLAREMDLMFPRSGDATSIGMSGMSMLFHPANAPILPKWMKSLVGKVPAAVGRGVVGVGLGKIADIATSPALMRFVTRGLTGTPVERDAARVVMFSIMAGAPMPEAMAAGASVIAEHMYGQPETEPPPKPSRSWRDMMRGGGEQPAWMNQLREGR